MRTDAAAGDAADREAAVVHRLERIEPWLDHVLELGLNGILLGPIFASSTHGYDTVDHFRIDPRLGDDGDFDRLVEAAHRARHPGHARRGLQPRRTGPPGVPFARGRGPGGGDR